MDVKELNCNYVVGGRQRQRITEGNRRRMGKAHGNRKNAGGRRHRKQNVAAMLCIMAVMCVLLAVICVMNAGLRQKIKANNEVIAGLEAEIEEEQGRTEKIEEEKKYMDSDEYVEKIAHEKIGLVYDNETIFKEQ